MANAKLGYYQLDQIRKAVPLAFVEKTQNYDKLNLTMLNTYLNKYCEKLSLKSSIHDTIDI